MLAAIAVTLLAGCEQVDSIASGRNYLEKGEYRSAVIEFKNALQDHPASVEARVLLADALERQHDLAGAEQHLRAAAANGGDADLLLPRIALLMLDRNNFEKLVLEFKDRRLGTAESDSTLRAMVAIAQLGLNRVPSAKQQLSGVVDTPAVALARAQMLVAEGKPAAALAQLRDARPDSGTFWWLSRATARIASAVGDHERALTSIKLAHDAVPWNHGVSGEYGEALISAGRLDEAAAVRDALRRQAPNFAWTHYLDALLLARAGRTDDSHAAAIRVLSGSPDHLPATLLAASAELQAGDLLMAVKRLQTVALEHPASLPVLRLLAQAHLRTGRLAEAADALSRGLRLAPADPALLALQPEVDLARNDPAQAVKSLSALLATRPNDGAALLRLADAKARLGERSASTALLDKAGAAAAMDGALEGRIVAAALRLGNVAQARRLAEAASAAQPDDPQAALTLAAAQSAQNDAQAAWATTSTVLDRHPGNAAALSALKAMARTREQQQEALARHAKAVQAKAADPQVYLDYAALASAQSPIGETAPKSNPASPTRLAILEQGLRAAPTAVPLRGALVEEFLRLGHTDKAVSAAQVAAAANGAPPAARALLVATYERVGQTQLAVEGLRRLVADYPQNPQWRLKLARLEATADRPAEAFKLLRALIKDRPFDLPAYLTLANLMAPQDPAGAISVARQLGERKEHKSAALLLEGDLLTQAGQHEQALRQFSDAARAGALPAALLRSVRVLDRLGRAPAAEQRMDEALRLYPDDTTVAAFAAERALRSGDASKAVELLQKLVAGSANDPVFLNDLAWAQIHAGDPQALENARKAVAGLPGNANALHTLGLALSRAGRQDEAIAALRTSANLAPLAALPRLHLSQHLAYSGDRNGAKAVLKSIDPARLEQKDQAGLAQLRSTLDRS